VRATASGAAVNQYCPPCLTPAFTGSMTSGCETVATGGGMPTIMQKKGGGSTPPGPSTGASASSPLTAAELRDGRPRPTRNAKAGSADARADSVNDSPLRRPPSEADCFWLALDATRLCALTASTSTNRKWICAGGSLDVGGSAGGGGGTSADEGRRRTAAHVHARARSVSRRRRRRRRWRQRWQQQRPPPWCDRQGRHGGRDGGMAVWRHWAR